MSIIKPSQIKIPDSSMLEIAQRAALDSANSSAGPTAVGGSAKSTEGFLDMLKHGISDVNATVRQSEQNSMNLASGNSGNLHETMLSTARAELGFQLLVQIRNRAIEAYQEIMKMQV